MLGSKTSLILYFLWFLIILILGSHFYQDIETRDGKRYRLRTQDASSPASKLGKKRILQNAKGGTKFWLNDIVDQIDETASKQKIPHYKDDNRQLTYQKWFFMNCAPRLPVMPIVANCREKWIYNNRYFTSLAFKIIWECMSTSFNTNCFWLFENSYLYYCKESTQLTPRILLVRNKAM